VLYQDYPHIEYIVVDGGSTDGCVDIIQHYQDCLTTWVSESDAGQADAINKGFHMASGEIVAWLNSDDYYFPYAVSTAVRRFQEDSDLTLFYGDAVIVTQHGDFQQYFCQVESFDSDRLFACSDYIMQPTTFFRRDPLFEVGLLDASLHYVMDWDLWCRLAKHGCRFHYEPHPIAVNRVYPDTKTSTGNWPRLVEIYQLIRRYKTSFWPHGFFGYLRSDIIESNLPGMIKQSAAALLLLPNWRNSLHALRHRRPLYGMDWYVPTRCAPKVTLYLPVLKPCQRLCLRLQIPFSKGLRQQSVDVRINGAYALTYHFATDPRPQTITVPLEAGLGEAEYLRIDLTFSHAAPRRTLWNLYRQQDLACILQDVQLVRECD
jgi:glycosyltransferase involved in cell wall biosynthesis